MTKLIDAPPRHWTLALPAGRALVLGERPLVMGVVNITPDSFSDGGLWLEADRAADHAMELLAQGADLVDLGAESTRPGGGVYGSGARDVPAEEEIARLLPALRRLRVRTSSPISVDTRKAAVARAALAAGADLINDVSGLGDPEMGAVLAAADCPLVLMHSRGALATMQRDIRFDDVLREVRDELADAMRRASAAGIATERLILDPGIGFGKTTEQNVLLLRRLDFLAALGRPLLVGASRKSFIGNLTGAEPQRRLAGSLAAAARAVAHGAALLRVHDVVETVQFLEIWRAIGSPANEGDV